LYHFSATSGNALLIRAAEPLSAGADAGPLLTRARNLSKQKKGNDERGDRSAQAQ